jgi:hypothetical protein
MCGTLVQNFFDWAHWETITHSMLCILTLYILYMLISNKNNRTFSNILLFTIIIALETLIHQNSNLHSKCNCGKNKNSCGCNK